MTYHVSHVLLPPALSSREIGLWQDEDEILAVSRCCLSVLVFHVNWACHSCGRIFIHADHALDVPAQAVATIRNELQVGLFAEAWTGLKLRVEVEWDE